MTAAGAATGFAALCQPSLILLPTAIVVYEVLRASALRRWAIRFVLLLFAMTAVISPWTIRNFVALGAYVPISTNGGTSLYLGNNPDANFRAIVAALRFGSGRRTGNHDGALRNGG